MTIAPSPSISLKTFLQRPESKPAQEYIDGSIVLKSMPKARHSRLQGKLVTVINAVTEAPQIAYAFPELRCTFGNRSIVPDIAVLQWKNIAFDSDGEPEDAATAVPDWTIEILSPEQSPNRVTGNILHCLKHGCQLGWLIDPGDRSILTFQPQQQPQLCCGSDPLPLLETVNLKLTTAEVFNWLKMQE